MDKKLSIEFPVVVNGKNLIATVEEEVDHPVQVIYRISFSDGFFDEFCLDDELETITGDKGKETIPYADAIRNDINFVSFIEADKFYHVFQERINGVKTNVWVIEKQDDSGEIYFAIYYNCFYRFELRRLGEEWISLSKSKVERDYIDPELAKKAGYLLYSMV